MTKTIVKEEMKEFEEMSILENVFAAGCTDCRHDWCIGMAVPIGWVVLILITTI